MWRNKKGFLTGLFVVLVILVADVKANPCANVHGTRFVLDPMSCITYFSCVDSVAHRKACPEPFLFNEAKQMCDFSKYVNCDLPRIFNAVPTVSNVFPTVSAVEIPTVRTAVPRAFNVVTSSPVPTVSNVFPTVSAATIPTVPTPGTGVTTPAETTVPTAPTISTVETTPETIPTVPTTPGTIPTEVPTETPQDPTVTVPTTENEVTIPTTQQTTQNPIVTQDPSQAICNNQFVPRGSCPSLGVHQYGVQGDCTVFQTCIQGRAMFTNCPIGLLWNIATCQCDWPGRANCPF
jgi:hypothetical protein